MNNNGHSGHCFSCGVAKNRGDYCQYCGAYYNTGSTEHRVQKNTSLLSLGSKYHVEHRTSGLFISWRWGNFLDNFLFVVIGGFFLFNGLRLCLEDWSDHGIGMGIGIGAIHAIVGGAVLARGLVNSFNRTSIVATPAYLRLKHHPIPWKRGFKIRADEIEQIIVTRRQRSSDDATWHYPVMQCITSNGERRSLVSGETEEEFADYEVLRQLIQKTMGTKLKSAVGAIQSNTNIDFLKPKKYT